MDQPPILGGAQQASLLCALEAAAQVCDLRHAYFLGLLLPFLHLALQP